MKINAQLLIDDLIDRTKGVIRDAKELEVYEKNQLNWKPTTKSWSVLECLEHLNLYGDYYLPELERAIKRGENKGGEVFRSGKLGNYFAKSVAPKEQLNTMKTFKDKDPSQLGSQLTPLTIHRFLDQQCQLLELLEKARKVNLTKTKTGVSISKWIKLRLGDTFRVVVYHNQRHIQQAQKVIQEL